MYVCMHACMQQACFLYLGMVMPPSKQLLSHPLLGQHLRPEGIPVRPLQPGRRSLRRGAGLFDQTALASPPQDSQVCAHGR